MADQDGGIPTPLEVERQLARMLAAKSISGSPNRAMLLEYVVKHCLQGAELSEDKIGYALFPGYAPDFSNDVRVTATNLRVTLAQYYAQEGTDDLVRIDLPRGRKYRPAFSYNPRAECVVHYRNGRKHLMRPDSLEVTLAWNDFFMAQSKQPAFAPAISALADAELRAQILNRFVAFDWSGFNFTEVETIALQAVEQDPTYWHGHYMHAVAKACRWQWEEARRSFDRALQLNPEECRGRFWYAAFLLAMGEGTKCAQDIEAIARERPENFLEQMAAGIFFYLSGDFRRAWRFLDSAYRLDRVSWAARVVFAMVNISLGKLTDAALNLSFSYSLPEATPRPFEEIFPGLAAHLSARRSDLAAARKILSRIKRDPGKRPRPEQLLLAYLAVGKTKEAIKALEELFEEHHPLMLALRHWPLLDPLRDNPAFEALIERMNLPRSQ